MKLQDVIDELERIKKEYGGEIEVVVRDRNCYDHYEPWFEVDAGSEGITIDL